MTETLKSNGHYWKRRQCKGKINLLKTTKNTVERPWYFLQKKNLVIGRFMWVPNCINYGLNVSFIIFKTTCLAKQGVINFVGFPCSENFSKVLFHILIGVFENTKVFIIHLKQPFTEQCNLLKTGWAKLYYKSQLSILT